MTLWSRVLAMPRQLLSGVGRATDQEPVSQDPDRQLRETPPDGFSKASALMPDADEDEHRG